MILPKLEKTFSNEKKMSFAPSSASIHDAIRIPVYQGLPPSDTKPGALIFNNQNGIIYFWTDPATGWVQIAAGNGNLTLNNTPSTGDPNEFSLVPNAPQSGPIFLVKRLVAGDNITLTEDTHSISLFSSLNQGIITFTTEDDSGPGIERILQTSPDTANPVNFKALQGGQGVNCIDRFTLIDIQVNPWPGRGPVGCAQLTLDQVIYQPPITQDSTNRVHMDTYPYLTPGVIEATSKGLRIMAGNPGLYLIIGSMSYDVFTRSSHQAMLINAEPVIGKTNLSTKSQNSATAGQIYTFPNYRLMKLTTSRIYNIPSPQTTYMDIAMTFFTNNVLDAEGDVSCVIHRAQLTVIKL